MGPFNLWIILLVVEIVLLISLRKIARFRNRFTKAGIILSFVSILFIVFAGFIFLVFGDANGFLCHFIQSVLKEGSVGWNCYLFLGTAVPVTLLIACVITSIILLWNLKSYRRENTHSLFRMRNIVFLILLLLIYMPIDGPIEAPREINISVALIALGYFLADRHSKAMLSRLAFILGVLSVYYQLYKWNDFESYSLFFYGLPKLILYTTIAFLTVIIVRRIRCHFKQQSSS
jgi:hypothetical protein